MVLKLERFSHLLGRFFGLGSPIGLEYLSLVLAGKDYLEEGYLVPQERV